VRGQAKLGNDAGWGDACDPVETKFREPEVAVGTGGDSLRVAVNSGEGKFADGTGRAHPANLGGLGIDKPHRVVWAQGNVGRGTVARAEPELGHGTGTGREDPPNAIGSGLGEPEV